MIKSIIKHYDYQKQEISKKTPVKSHVPDVAPECPYGIITTNRKSPVESRVLRFSVWFFHPFPNRKIILK